MSREPAAAGIGAVLLDIEGTTTPLAFVLEVLFPYARRHLQRHVERYVGTAEYGAIFDRFRDEHADETRAGEAVPDWVETSASARAASVVRYAHWLMERDRKSPALKVLQGRIWEEGYRSGELIGDVFPDVPAAFARWQQRQWGIGIFSSGSVLAQQLLFRYSSAGDLTRFLRFYFDTETGGKADPASYQRIAAAMSLPPNAIVFASDATRELDAARRAGMQCRLTARPGNTPLTEPHDHVVIHTFDALG